MWLFWRLVGTDLEERRPKPAYYWFCLSLLAQLYPSQKASVTNLTGAFFASAAVKEDIPAGAYFRLWKMVPGWIKKPFIGEFALVNKQQSRTTLLTSKDHPALLIKPQGNLF